MWLNNTYKPCRLLVEVGASQKLKQICTYRRKGPPWHIKTKAKSWFWFWEKGLQWDKIGEESKSIPKAAARDKPYGEEKKKKRNQKPKQRRNKAAEEKKERNFNVNVLVTWVLKSMLFYLMREVNCSNFIGGV